MGEEYDWGVYEIFQEQIESEFSALGYHISVLDQEEHVNDSLNELFRFIHNYKATSSYLLLTPMNELMSKVETVLGSLRESKSIVQASVMEWLVEIKEQLLVWSHEMEEKETILSTAPKHLFSKIKITKPYINPSQKLKMLTLLYIDTNVDRAKKIVPYFKKLLQSVTYASDIDSAKNLLQTDSYDIVITNLDNDNYRLIEYIKSNFANIPIIAVFDKISTSTSKKLLRHGINHTLTNPIKVKHINRELTSIVKIFYSSSNILIDHKKINSFINTLEPLPNTVLQIIQICDDEEIPIKELLKVVKTDPIISANILKIANSPIYSSVKITTIDQAVTKFGKRAVKAFSMAESYKALAPIDLSAYAINETTFSKIAMSRLSLMLKWYSKISIADLSILSSTALLGNIGQLLISREIVAQQRTDNFKVLCDEFDIKYAEESTIYTTTNNISSQILRYWKLSKDIIDIIAYSDNPLESPIELRKLAVANSIVYTLVDLKGNISSEVPDELLPLLEEYDFDKEVLAKALYSIQD